MKTILFAFAFATLMAPAVLADEPQTDLDKLDAALASSPDDPMLHYRKCRILFTSGKENDAINHAAVALSKFKLAKNDLAWIGLGSFSTKDYQIDVHYNMGQKERAEPRDGIVRPYSFRVWTKGDDADLVHVLDFELAYSDSEVVSAAIGEMLRTSHVNYGIVDSKSDFTTVRKKVLDILSR